MPIFWHNPLAEMYGPDFLAVYATVIAVIIAVCFYLRYSLDASSSLPPLRVPSSPDPYEIAYLRGGANEVIRAATYKLLKLGYLKTEPLVGRAKKSNAQQIAHGEQAPDTAHMNLIDDEVMRYFERPATSASLFSSAVPMHVDDLCKAHLSSLSHENLLSPPGSESKTRPIRFFGTLGIVLFGGYKLIAALHNGHYNVAFLIMLAILGVTFLIVATRVPRLSSRGKNYLHALRQAYGSTAELRRGRIIADASSAIPMSVLAFSVLGTGALVGTPDAAYGSLFARAKSSASGGCGGGAGSCGSGSCGGGGGGGGCGGGGCGGCGGGS